MSVDWKLARKLVPALFLGLTFSTAGMAQTGSVNFEVSFAGTVDCMQPIAMSNVPISGHGTGVLNADGSASADVTQTALMFSNQVHFDGRLGARPTTAPGGTAQLRVAGKHRLQLIWMLPNNSLITNIAVNGRSCSASFDARLRPGKSQYTLYDGSGFHYCGKPRVAQATCQVR